MAESPSGDLFCMNALLRAGLSVFVSLRLAGFQALTNRGDTESPRSRREMLNAETLNF